MVKSEFISIKTFIITLCDNRKREGIQIYRVIGYDIPRHAGFAVLHFTKIFLKNKTTTENLVRFENEFRRFLCALHPKKLLRFEKK